MTPKEAKERLCVALDVPDAGRAIAVVKELRDHVGMFKIGLELFTSEGPAIVKAIADLGVPVFLDLKFHDIPNTVAGSVRAATRLGVRMCNLHAAGGLEMMQAAVGAAQDEASKRGTSRPLILAVTVLTSIAEGSLRDELLVESSLPDAVRHLAKRAQMAGIDGVIASPHEVPVIRQECGDQFLTVTPGIRPKTSDSGDQKRFTTPSDAMRLGSHFIVVGRPILSSKDPQAAAMSIVKEMSSASD